jgi:probable F420-dependent oxidoreductase
MTLNIGRIGIWSTSRVFAVEDRGEVAAELDSLGFGALWIGLADPGLVLMNELLGATERMTVATGIVNVWTVEPADLAAAYRGLADKDRFVLGLGNSHAPAVEALGRAYERPLTFLQGFLDGLDVPADRTVLAALGPKALRLAADRSAGAHPYLVTPAYTAQAREVLGTGPLLAVEQKVVLETDPGTARGIARERLRPYLSFPNYVNNWLRHGFTEDDVAGDGSDRLVDAMFAWGTLEQAAARIAEHHAAGADHVCVQVVTAALEIQGVRVELTASVAKAMTEALARYQDPRDRGFCEQCGGRRLDEHLICADCGSANSIFAQMLLERASRYDEPPALP